MKWLARLYNRATWRKLVTIADSEKLWRAVYNRLQIKNDGTLKPGFFQDKSGLSCDLASYTTIERARLGFQEPLRPSYSGLAEFTVGSVRSQNVSSDVEHKPVVLNNGRRNYAHCQLTTSLSTQQARELQRRTSFRVTPDHQRLRGGS